jgi:acyl-CoA synthetase (AMP-forming)/AMP-acid ligase II
MNIASRLETQATLFPDKAALITKRATLSFLEFNRRCSLFAHHFKEMGLQAGDLVSLFIKPGEHFTPVVFALFKMGAVPVFIDPGMGKKNLLNAIQTTKPVALVGEPAIHLARKLYPKNFASVKFTVSTGRTWGQTQGLSSWLKNKQDISFTAIERNPDDRAAILFTSGGTGAPKGVETTHAILNTQTEMLREMFGLTPNETDLAGFPLFALFTLALGMTSVVPDMDPKAPAKCDPEKLVQNILSSKASFIAGSPAIWERVAQYCQNYRITLPTVKWVVMFGAPVRREIHEAFKLVLTNGDTYTPYGATECLPVSLISGSELLLRAPADEMKFLGTDIGIAASGVEIRVIEPVNGTIAHISEAKTLPGLCVGEIIVRGPTVTPRYFEKEEATNLAKIQGENGELWHRMGDLGQFDSEGHLRFCGRVAHRVSTHNPIPIEAVYNRHPAVKRSALISYRGHPAIVLELKKYSPLKRKKIIEETCALSKQYSHTQDINRIFVAHSFPVDVRHNIKIDRTLLSKWANEGRLS